MWLVYLRFRNTPADGFDDGVRTYHVRADNRTAVDIVLSRAEKHGLTPTARLVEHAVFYSDRLMKPKATPNLHYFEAKDFHERWLSADAPAK